jgi:DNA-binding CsgD family transcriptional regulator
VSDSDPLERGRACYERREWADAYQSLALADQLAPLNIQDLTRLAWSAALVGRDDAMLAAHERLYQLHLDANDELEAARSAFWLGFRLSSLNEPGRAAAWLARAERLVDRQNDACAIKGYLLLPLVHRYLASSDFDAATASAARAVEIGEQFREPDLMALGRNLHGRALLRTGKITDGLALLDEAMLAVTAGELSPIVTGLIYCNVIAGCQQIHAVERAREWTAALSGWCDAQPQLVKFTGACLVHRAEIMQFSGAWHDAMVEAQRATTLKEAAFAVPEAAANGFYQLGEIHRLRGEFEAAQIAYQRAGEMGREPQPGLALMRLAQGQQNAAVIAIRRVVGVSKHAFQRIGLLLPYVEILIDAGAIEDARAACVELRELASQFTTSFVSASAAHADGALLLAGGDAQKSLEPLQRAFHSWQQLGSPYMAARTRVLLARACHALGDRDASQLQVRAARAAFQRLGAIIDLAALDREQIPANHGLTTRELEVLQLIATGKTNKIIARELALSEKTVDRHTSNIFNKLDLPSRAAATAYAYRHHLIATSNDRYKTSPARSSLKDK